MQMNILSVAPITAAQFGTNFFYKSLHHQLTGSDTMSSRDRIATSFAAGATSAVLANPTELVVIRQQQTGLPLGTACYQLFRTHGLRAITTAIVPTMLREGIYASFWMEVCLLLSVPVRKPSQDGVWCVHAVSPSVSDPQLPCYPRPLLLPQAPRAIEEPGTTRAVFLPGPVQLEWSVEVQPVQQSVKAAHSETNGLGSDKNTLLMYEESLHFCVLQ
jgi:hypothetical protein